MAYSFEQTERMLRTALTVEHNLMCKIAQLVSVVEPTPVKFVRSKHHAHSTERLRYTCVAVQELQAKIESIKAQDLPPPKATPFRLNTRHAKVPGTTCYSIPDIKKLIGAVLDPHVLDFRFRSLKGGCKFFAIRFTAQFLTNTYKVGEVYEEIRKQLQLCGYNMTASKGEGADEGTRTITIMRGAPDIQMLESGTQLPTMPAGYLLTDRKEVQSRMGY